MVWTNRMLAQVPALLVVTVEQQVELIIPEFELQVHTPCVSDFGMEISDTHLIKLSTETKRSLCTTLRYPSQ